MTDRSIAPRLCAWLAAATVAVAAAACAGRNPPPPASTGDDLQGATSVAADTAATGDTGTAAGSTNNTVGAGTGQASAAATVVGPMFVIPYGTGTPLCLAPATTPPTDGTAVVLAECANVAGQHWISDRGRLIGQGNLCLTNVGATVAATPTPAQLAAVLTACNPNASEVRQHVELQFGAVLNATGPGTFALTVINTGTASSGQLYWATYNANDTAQAFRLTAAPGDANAIAVTAAPEGFAVRVSGSTNCLDANAALATGNNSPASVAACDATSVSQAWSVDVYGRLTNAGLCLDSNAGTLSLSACGQAAPSQQWQGNYGQLVGATRCLTAASPGGVGGLKLASCDGTSTLWSLGRTP